MNKRFLGIAGAMLAGAVAGGCGITQPTPRLPADAFVRYQPNPGQGVDRGGFVQLEGHAPNRAPPPDEPHVSPSVREVVKAPFPESLDTVANATVPPTQPAVVAEPPRTTQPAVATGVFQWVGCVVARVDGEPIYADKVLSTLDRALKAEAQAGDEARFRAVARDLVMKQITEFIDNELEFTAAKKALEKKDESIAKLLTAEWRKEQVRKAGGSEAQARKRAAEEGFDFEDLARQQYRINMTRLYYQSKIIPLIQVRAQDMRQFYQANLRKFQTPAAVKFRVLWISADATGSRELALKKALEVYELAKAGEDFSDLADRFNHDPALKRTKGVVGNEKGWIQKGDFAAESVEKAVWDLHPGQVSSPIDAKNRDRDGFWIAKLDDIQPGRTEPFESQKVQTTIHNFLHTQQLNKLRKAHQIMLQRQAVVIQTEGAVDIVMQMAMQRYKVWVASR